MSDSGRDVVVIGGGIVGAAAAAFLSMAGAKVTLIEREGLASGASGANSGVVQHPFDPILAGLYGETVTLYRELSGADLGFAFGAAPAGMLYVSEDEAAVRRVDAALAEGFPDLPREVMSGAALRRVEPAVAPDLWACRVGIGYPVQPAGSTYAYATLAERYGATIRLGRAAVLDLRGDAIMGVVVDGSRIEADAVLVAAGPWSPGLVDPSGRWVPIQDRWGVVVETELEAGPRHVLEEAEIDAAIGAVPDGQPLAFDPEEALEEFSLVPLASLASVGSTFLARQPDPAVWVERLLVRASRFVPSVTEAPIRGSRACARPQSLDGRPLIGRVPGRRGLFICAGHGAWGISTGPASARLVVDQILGHDPHIPESLDPGRFGPIGI